MRRNTHLVKLINKLKKWRQLNKATLQRIRRFNIILKPKML